MSVDDVIFARGRNAISRTISPASLAALRAMRPDRIEQYRDRNGLVGYSFSVQPKPDGVEVTAWWFDHEPVSALGRDILEATIRVEGALAKQRANEAP